MLLYMHVCSVGIITTVKLGKVGQGLDPDAAANMCELLVAGMLTVRSRSPGRSGCPSRTRYLQATKK